MSQADDDYDEWDEDLDDDEKLQLQPLEVFSN